MWEKADSWDGQPAPALSSSKEYDSPTRVSVAAAIATFMSIREGEEIALSTLRKYRTFTKQLLAFAESHGYKILDQFTSADVDAFYSGLKLGARTKGKRRSTIRSFFRFCTNRKWLRESPVSVDLKPPKGANRVANKVPFTDEELHNIIAACDRLGEISWQSGSRSGMWNGEDAKDFIWTLT